MSIAGSCTVRLKTTGKGLLAAESSRRVRSGTNVFFIKKYTYKYKYKYKIGTKLVQVYAPSNEAEYREYREWFLSINTASGGDA